MKSPAVRHLTYPLVFAIAVASRAPALGSWWCLDDWGQLARAAGILTRETSLPARWLSQDLWWALTWPLFGLNALPHAALRLMIHAIAAVLVARLAHKAIGHRGLGLLAGTLFAVTPIAFTILYWASGIQELLAGVLVLAAVERWWFGGRSRVWQATLCGIASIFAKEPGFGLPILLSLHLLWCNRRVLPRASATPWLAVGVLLVAVVVESVVLLGNFATGPTDPYRLGGLPVMFGNVGIFGWWLATPGPVFTSQFDFRLAGLGSLLFVAWGLWGWLRWRHQSRLALTAWAAALLSLGPSLLLVQQTHPYLAYVAAAALSITMADLWPRRWHSQTWLLGAAVLLSCVVGSWNMAHRAGMLGDDGLPDHPIVRSAAIARTAAPIIRAQLAGQDGGPPLKMVLLQQPQRARNGQGAEPGSDRDVLRTPSFMALGGDLGPRLLAGPGSEVVWANSLLRAPPEARVLHETNGGFIAWGDTWHALLYATLSDLIAGHHQRARAELAQALRINEDLDLFIYDARLLAVPQQTLVKHGDVFQEWLTEQGAVDRMSAQEVAFLRRGAGTLLSAARD